MKPDASMQIRVEDLHAFTAALFNAAGQPLEHGAIMADALVGADVRGASSHGIIRLPQLLSRLRDGGANPFPQITTISEACATALLDADAALGPIGAHSGMTMAVSKAEACGVGFVAVRNSDFIGTCAHSAMLALDRGMIGMTWTNGFPGMAPWGGRTNAIGNNPIGFAVPGGAGGPVVLDFAMSVTAGGWVRHAAKEGRPIPDGWVIDADGNDTNDPADLPKGGALLALGHKGYGLAVIGEVLAGVLAGAKMLGQIPHWFNATDQRVGNGHVHLAIDIRRFIDPADFADRMDEMALALKKTPLRPGVDQIVLPGEAATRRTAAHLATGLRFNAAIAADLRGLAETYGIPMNEMENQDA